MGQIERDMHARQYENIRQERAILDRINPSLNFVQVGLGALVDCSLGLFFVSVSVGIMMIEDQKVMALSPQSPIGVLLMGKRAGQVFRFQNKDVLINLVS
jgi:hypothetical protein